MAHSCSGPVPRAGRGLPSHHSGRQDGPAHFVDEETEVQEGWWLPRGHSGPEAVCSVHSTFRPCLWPGGQLGLPGGERFPSLPVPGGQVILDA